jgi:hypothetical protein
MRLPGTLRFARIAGSSIAAPGAAPWFTDFLNAAYCARPESEPDVEDLRLAHGIVTTRWSELGGRRLGAADVVALHRAFSSLRLRRRGRLDHATLLAGATRPLGPWFPEAWADERRRVHGIAFAGVAEAEAFIPERRLRRAALGPPSRPAAPRSSSGINTQQRGFFTDADNPGDIDRARPPWRSARGRCDQTPPPGNRRWSGIEATGEAHEGGRSVASTATPSG